MFKKLHLRKENTILLLLVIFSLAFSFWLSFKTFSYSNGSMEIATKAWSDFASHIPLIRSFSFGDNIPPQYPLFPGSPIRYHYLFYAFVGLLEKIGLRIDFALNIPSALGFAGLIVMIYCFAKKLFDNTKVALLSVLFFLLNGSLSFLEFFKDHPLNKNTFFDIIYNNAFSSFAPYGKGIVSAFWNLNIYTNQRHLALSYGLSLLAMYFLFFKIESKKNNWKLGIIIGVILGLSFFLNMAVFLMTILLLIAIAILFPEKRNIALVILCFAGLLAYPQYHTIQTGGANFKLMLNPGYLISGKLTLVTFLYYWFFNLGLHSIFMILGFLFAPKRIRKLFLCFLILFIVGNTFQFSVEMAANHKFFNYFMLIGNMFSAYSLIYLWERKKIFKPLVIVSVLLLIFSGIIDFFPVANDGKFTLQDYQQNEEINWIKENTPKNAVFLNSSYLYHPASLAGRKIFLGWPYFAWSQGYDTTGRDMVLRKMLNPSSEKDLCSLLKENDISYVSIEKYPKNSDFSINFNFFNSFQALYSAKNGTSIYKTSTLCEKI